MTVLDHLLMGTTSSILRKTLMESGLGDAITGGGLSDELLQATFSVGLKGVVPDNVDKVEELIVETLKKVAEEGFTDDAIVSRELFFIHYYVQNVTDTHCSSLYIIGLVNEYDRVSDEGIQYGRFPQGTCIDVRKHAAMDL